MRRDFNILQLLQHAFYALDHATPSTGFLLERFARGKVGRSQAVGLTRQRNLTDGWRFFLPLASPSYSQDSEIRSGMGHNAEYKQMFVAERREQAWT